jgi:succinyl-CoA--D-citramalate CoA-transferase
MRVSGYGQSGPYRDRAGFGAIGEAMGGVRHVTGFPDRPPRTGISLGDSLAGTFGALGALTALYHRQTHGRRGQVVDVGIYEAVLALMESTIPEYALPGHVRGRTGTVPLFVAPSNIYPNQGGDFVLIAGNPVYRHLPLARSIKPAPSRRWHSERRWDNDVPTGGRCRRDVYRLAARP